MPDSKGNLLLFEAIELRNDYDRHIKLFENLIEGDDSKRERYLSDKEDEKQPVEEFRDLDVERILKNLKTKRVKLNQAIQAANFSHQIHFDGEAISIAEALEIRKSLLIDLGALSKSVVQSAYKRIIYKEGRDIIHEPKHSFNETYHQYIQTLQKLRLLILQIHTVNHQGVVQYREE